MKFRLELITLIISATISIIIFYITFSATNEKYLHVPETSFDCGLVQCGDFASHIFEIKNVSPKPISIDKIETTCFCATATPSDNIIMPNQTIEIDFSYEVSIIVGQYGYSCLIYFQNEKIKPIKLDLNTYGYTPNLVLSHSLIDFGEVCIGKSVAEKVQIQNVDYPNGVWEIKEIASDNENIAINWEPDNKYFTCNLLSEEIGSVAGNVTVTTIKGTEESKTLLPIKGEIVGKIIAEPRQLFLGQQQAASIIEKVIKLKPLVDTIPLDIKLAVAVPNGGKWEITEQNEKEIDISVSFPTPQKKGLYNDTIIVTVETNSKYELRVPVSCNIR